MVAKRIHCLESLPVWPALVWAMILAGSASGITILVPEHYPKITDALVWATNGDEIIVSPGVYVENIENQGPIWFKGKNVILRSVNPTDPATVAATIIDGNKKGPVVTFAGTETSSRVLSGFTIRNGNGGIYDRGNISPGKGGKARIEHNMISNNSVTGYGGGLWGCNGTIRDNVIAGNSASGAGGGLYQCNGTIQNNVITSNSGYSTGGGLDECNGTIQNNVITSNSASAPTNLACGGGLYQCNGTIQNNVITSNSASANGYDFAYGSGLGKCKGTIRNNTICYNSATGQGGGFYECTGVIANCIIWGNTARVYSQVSYDSIPNYSCIQGYTVGQGQGNIGLNPRFVGTNDFHLLPDSPCIDAGTNTNCPTTDKDGNKRPYDGNGDGQAVCDMGAYEYVGRPYRVSVPPRLWTLYR